MSVDIQGLDKIELLRRLWTKQCVASALALTGGPPFNENNAGKAVNTGFIDYYCGRAIKTNLSGNTANTALYNRDAGHNAFETIVKEMRAD